MKRKVYGVTLVALTAGCFDPNSVPLGADTGEGTAPSSGSAGETGEMDSGASAGSEGEAGTSGNATASASASASGDSMVTASGGSTGEDPPGEETNGPSPLCGNGDLDDGEECDLGDANSDSGACTDTCRLATCGDGLVQAGEEDCDDAGESSECNADCSTATCGDGVINASAQETCDGEKFANGACDQCQVVCTAGWADCAGGLADGCEAFVDADGENCGSCGSTCDELQVCSASDCVDIKRVFLSSWVVWADFGGVHGADQLCQDMAGEAGLDGEFFAWVSSADEGISVADRFNPHSGPYVLIDGTVVANDWDDLIDGTLGAAILLDEYGEAPGGFSDGNCHGGPTCTSVFTGATAGGGAYEGQHDDCDGWSTTTFLPAFAGGDANATDAAWSLFAAGLRCDYAARLYCFEQ